MFIQGKGKEENTFDAIVVGSGISGGWAAKELTEKGLKVALLERGRDVKHIADYKTASLDPWEFPHRGRVDEKTKKDYYVNVRTGYTANEEHRHFFENDVENPFKEKRRFDWIRGYHTGGRSLMWGRQSYRWNERDFTANAEEGVAIDWPIRYKDLAPWYDKVERYIGVAGTNEGYDVLPDGVFQPGFELNCVEKDVKKAIEANFDGRHLTIGRTAHLTAPTPEQLAAGRGTCQARNRCMRGCPYGAYFSTQSSTLPAAKKTNNLTLINDKIVFEVIYDDEAQKAIGVRAIDQNTKDEVEYYAKVIFLNAGSINSTAIMMQSKSKTHPNGLGNASDQLGKNIMDHHLEAGARGSVEGYIDKYYSGRRPTGFYIPRFANWGNDKRDFLRGFGYQGAAGRGRGAQSDDTFGADFKEAMTQPGPWYFYAGGFGECLPYESNKMVLTNETDSWGLPIIEFDAAWGDNEWKMREAMADDAAEMLEAAGVKNVSTFNNKEKAPGIGIHEMGTARMGHDPKTSCLNKHNQVWNATNVYVTDGACMTSASCVNPSLTYMALTARAAEHAVEELKKMNI